MNLDEQQCRALLAENIKRFRNKIGFSQLDLALEINISTTFMSDIEMGRKWVSAKTLTEIAKALKVNVFELLMPEDETAPCAQEITVKYLKKINSALTQSFEESINPVLSALNGAVTKLTKIAENMEHCR